MYERCTTLASFQFGRRTPGRCISFYWKGYPEDCLSRLHGRYKGFQTWICTKALAKDRFGGGIRRKLIYFIKVERDNWHVDSQLKGTKCRERCQLLTPLFVVFKFSLLFSFYFICIKPKTKMHTVSPSFHLHYVTAVFKSCPQFLENFTLGQKSYLTCGRAARYASYLLLSP